MGEPALQVRFKTEGAKRAFQVVCTKQGHSASSVLAALAELHARERMGDDEYDAFVAEVDDAVE